MHDVVLLLDGESSAGEQDRDAVNGGEERKTDVVGDPVEQESLTLTF